MFSNARAQSQDTLGADAGLTHIKSLQIGDNIPEELWHLPLQIVNHPDRKGTTTLNDYRGKLIILDFWATW
ncbi:MAG TPA: TlpA family protein disulfide reductase, partial [Sphingobacterium sp.]|nr:TlpA family protein disulfide reductase [Sphingobacterium sp.]